MHLAMVKTPKQSFCFAMHELSILMSAIGAEQATAYSCAGLGDALISGYTQLLETFQRDCLVQDRCPSYAGLG